MWAVIQQIQWALWKIRLRHGIPAHFNRLSMRLLFPSMAPIQLTLLNSMLFFKTVMTATITSLAQGQKCSSHQQWKWFMCSYTTNRKLFFYFLPTFKWTLSVTWALVGLGKVIISIVFCSLPSSGGPVHTAVQLSSAVSLSVPGGPCRPLAVPFGLWHSGAASGTQASLFSRPWQLQNRAPDPEH